MKYKLRGYQEKAVKDIVEYYTNYSKPGIAVLPTGAGKSLIIAEAIRRLGNIPTLILQPSVELLQQNHEKYIDQGGEASFYSASVGEKVVSNVTYATIGSIKKVPNAFKHVKLVLIDECHLHTGSGSMMDKFIKKLGNKVVIIGLTATPIRLKAYGDYDNHWSQLSMLNRITPRFFSKIFHVTQVSTLLDLKYLSPLRFTPYKFDRSVLKTSGSDFDKESMEYELDRQGAIRFGIDLIKEALKRGKKRILIFTPTVEGAHKLQKEIPEIRVVSAKTKKSKRRDIVKEFRAGDIRVVANYGTLVTGFDVPELDLIVLMRPTKSFAVYYQMCGRGMRIAEGKSLCDVVDISGNYNEFGDVRDLVIKEHKEYGWGMFVNDYLISGIPVGQKTHVSQLSFRTKKFPFGKYEGKTVDEIPANYFEWLAKNFDLTTSYNKKNVVPFLKLLGINY